jgi:hypothetical protein
MRITPLNMTYRGFELGWYVGLPGLGYKAAWRSSLEGKWREGHMYVDTVEEIPELCRQCIDFQYRVEATEAALGRKLTINEFRPDL